MRELDSIRCLKTVGDSNFAKFAYMLDGENKGVDLKKRLDGAEDIAHYDLACLRLEQKKCH